MAVQSRLKNGVASLAYVTAIHAVQSPPRLRKLQQCLGVDGRDKPGQDGGTGVPNARVAMLASIFAQRSSLNQNEA
jgi:hypothetical protein